MSFVCTVSHVSDFMKRILYSEIPISCFRLQTSIFLFAVADFNFCVSRFTFAFHTFAFTASHYAFLLTSFGEQDRWFRFQVCDFGFLISHYNCSFRKCLGNRASRSQISCCRIYCITRFEVLRPGEPSIFISDSYFP